MRLHKERGRSRGAPYRGNGLRETPISARPEHEDETLARALATEALAGIASGGRIKAQLRRLFERARPSQLTRARAADLAHEVLRLERRIPPGTPRQAVDAVADHDLRARDPAEGLPIQQKVAVIGSLPDWFAERLVLDFGQQRAVALARALSDRPTLVVRANRMRTSRDRLMISLSDRGFDVQPSLAPDAILVKGSTDVALLPELANGEFEVQDEASQLVSLLVAPPPGGAVLDFCAGAGGKSLHLASILGGRGRVWATDPSEARLLELRRRARRAGLSNLRAHPIAPEGSLPEELQSASFDRILIDAPCSGSGVLRRKPDLRKSIDSQSPARLAEAQRRILERVLPLLRRGARLIYSTCSLFSEENDQLIDAFQEAHPELEVVPAKEILGRVLAEKIGDGARLRMFPDEHGTDGFFAVVLRLRRSL